MARPSMKPKSGFNAAPKVTNMQGSGLTEAARNRSVRNAWRSVNNELSSHASEGIEVEPIRRAKIASRLQRDHHRAERRTARTRQILKGRIGG